MYIPSAIKKNSAIISSDNFPADFQTQNDGTMATATELLSRINDFFRSNILGSAIKEQLLPELYNLVNPATSRNARLQAFESIRNMSDPAFRDGFKYEENTNTGITFTLGSSTNIITVPDNNHHYSAASESLHNATTVFTQDAISGINVADIKEKHQQIDALYKKFSGIPQPCFLVAEFIQSGLLLDVFAPTPDLMQVAETGKQIDFGPIFSGTEMTSTIGAVERKEYKNSVSDKKSVILRGTEAAINRVSIEIRQELQNNYPHGCIIKTGGGVGHYAFFDTKNNIVYSGGTIPFAEKISGVTLETYLRNKLNSSNQGRMETLSVTDHSAKEILDVGYEQIKALGISREEWMTWE